MHALQYRVVGDGYRRAVALMNGAEDQIIRERMRHTEPSRDSKRISPGLTFRSAVLPCAHDGRASRSLHRNHLGALAANPVELLQLIECLPHPDHPGTATGWVNDCVG